MNEGGGHRRDALLVLEESGLADVLYEDRIPFVDLNTSAVVRAENVGKSSKLKELYFRKAYNQMISDLVAELRSKARIEPLKLERFHAAVVAAAFNQPTTASR